MSEREIISSKVKKFVLSQNYGGFIAITWEIFATCFGPKGPSDR